MPKANTFYFQFGVIVSALIGSIVLYSYFGWPINAVGYFLLSYLIIAYVTLIVIRRVYENRFKKFLRNFEESPQFQSIENQSEKARLREEKIQRLVAQGILFPDPLTSISIPAVLTVGIALILVSVERNFIQVDTNNLQPAYGFLKRNEGPPRNYGAYGYVLLTQPLGNDTNEIRRANYVAELFRTVFLPYEDFRSFNIPTQKMMFMAWMVTNGFNRKTHKTGKDMVTYYDYVRASIITANIKRKASTGPVLVAGIEPLDESTSAQEALIFDLSNFDNEDLKRAFQIWKDRISEDPQAWDKGFKLEYFRSAFRNFMIKYSDPIYKTLTKKD